MSPPSRSHSVTAESGRHIPHAVCSCGRSVVWIEGGWRHVDRDTVARPESAWHEDFGDVLWWRFPIEEAPWVGSPLDEQWQDGYYTHWTPLPEVPSLA